MLFIFSLKMKMVIYMYIYITYSSIRFELFVFCIYFSNISNKNVYKFVYKFPSASLHQYQFCSLSSSSSFSSYPMLIITCLQCYHCITVRKHTPFYPCSCAAVVLLGLSFRWGIPGRNYLISLMNFVFNKELFRVNSSVNFLLSESLST